MTPVEPVETSSSASSSTRNRTCSVFKLPEFTRSSTLFGVPMTMLGPRSSDPSWLLTGTPPLKVPWVISGRWMYLLNLVISWSIWSTNSFLGAKIMACGPLETFPGNWTLGCGCEPPVSPIVVSSLAAFARPFVFSGIEYLNAAAPKLNSASAF